MDSQEKNRQTLADIQKELEEKQLNYENWSKLNELFGSQSGVKFKEIAQGYTLDVLLLYANKHLQDLAPRYELQRISDTLALQIVDLDMMGEVRSVHSLSGGESFGIVGIGTRPFFFFVQPDERGVSLYRRRVRLP